MFNKQKLNTWKRNFAVLRTQTDPTQGKGLLESLIDIACSAGIDVVTKGKFPQSEAVASLMTSAATEALTNAVRHADACVLTVVFSETENYYCASYTNDGTPPAEEIREGGGLGSLRSKTERLGGTMEIQSLPQFKMTIELPKEGDMF